MPVSCSASITKLSTDELRELDYRVMRHAFDSHNELGRLADERIYQADLAARLQSAGMKVSREVEVQLSRLGNIAHPVALSRSSRVSTWRNRSCRSDAADQS